MKKNTEASTEQFLRIINQLIFNEKNNVLVYGNLKLFPSEIHLILMIANGKSENYNTVVQGLGVTKGAVSQTISRLVKKGILEKKKIDNKDLVILLTDLGKKVQKKCRMIQEGVQNQFSSYLNSLPADDRRVIGEFLDHIGTALGIEKR